MTPAELHNYIFTELVCGCGDPSGAIAFLRDLLQIVNDRSRDDNLSFDEVQARIQSLFNNNNQVLEWWIWYLLDQRDLIEHGGNVSGGWLTDKGQELLAGLKAVNIKEFNRGAPVMPPPPPPQGYRSFCAHCGEKLQFANNAPNVTIHERSKKRECENRNTFAQVAPVADDGYPRNWLRGERADGSIEPIPPATHLWTTFDSRSRQTCGND